LRQPAFEQRLPEHRRADRDTSRQPGPDQRTRRALQFLVPAAADDLMDDSRARGQTVGNRIPLLVGHVDVLFAVFTLVGHCVFLGLGRSLLRRLAIGAIKPPSTGR
jgi:hypothetical protein